LLCRRALVGGLQQPPLPLRAVPLGDDDGLLPVPGLSGLSGRDQEALPAPQEQFAAHGEVVADLSRVGQTVGDHDRPLLDVGVQAEPGVGRAAQQSVLLVRPLLGPGGGALREHGSRTVRDPRVVGVEAQTRVVVAEPAVADLDRLAHGRGGRRPGVPGDL
jgi:hypothetical protein